MAARRELWPIQASPSLANAMAGTERADWDYQGARLPYRAGWRARRFRKLVRWIMLGRPADTWILGLRVCDDCGGRLAHVGTEWEEDGALRGGRACLPCVTVARESGALPQEARVAELAYF